MSGKCKKHIFLSGRVQGVGFRASIRKKAGLLNINGWVKNLRDGRVEAVFTGNPENVEEIINFAKKGPRYARVDNIEVNEEEYRDEYKNFQIKF